MELRKNIFAFNLMVPAIFIIGLVMVYPTIFSLIMSFFDWRFNKPLKFIGIKNTIEKFI